MPSLAKPFAAAFAGLAFGVAPGLAAAADPQHPTVVELFQSQGCSSCPPANANLIALSARPDLLTLSFGVTYWDQLGWKDTFASPQYTARQWDYAHAFHHDNVATPQVVVNGRADVVGSDRGELEAMIRRQDRGTSGPALTLTAATVRVGAARDGAHSGRVLLVRYDPRIEQVAIRAGENDGRTLPHKDVVKALIDLGAWTGEARAYALPPASRAGLREAILVQAGIGGPIVAATTD